jgi:hypothetical protein
MSLQVEYVSRLTDVLQPVVDYLRRLDGTPQGLELNVLLKWVLHMHGRHPAERFMAKSFANRVLFRQALLRQSGLL